MIKKITIYVVISLLAFNVKAQFDSQAARSSLVRVVVNVNRNESNVQTGFVWKSPDQIITSMHGMSPNGTINVLFHAGNAWRVARIKKVLPKADLVLLELAPGQPAPPAGVRPITSFSTDPIPLRTEVYTVGYNSGAIGSSSRTLKRGDLDPPETLARLVPPKDEAVLKRVGFPDINIPIIFLDGSLLPGFSGAPVFTANNRLIGIGDGGLEKGASNVSWIIPAKYITELENSNITTLPANFEQVALLFSARVTVETTSDDLASLEKTLSNPTTPQPVRTNDFEFYLTKNRSISEMLETSDDPDNMFKFSEELAEFNVNLDYASIRFDIYEDILHGVVLAVPEGKTFYYDTETESFLVDLDGNDYMALAFAGLKDDFTFTDFEDLIEEVSDYIDEHLANVYGISGFTIDEDYSYWLDFGEDRKIAWISSAGNEEIYDDYGNIYTVGTYLTILMSTDKTFMALSAYIIPVELVVQALDYGFDCTNPGWNAQQCEYFDMLFKVFSSAHLTTFAW